MGEKFPPRWGSNSNALMARLIFGLFQGISDKFDEKRQRIRNSIAFPKTTFHAFDWLHQHAQHESGSICPISFGKKIMQAIENFGHYCGTINIDNSIYNRSENRLASQLPTFQFSQSGPLQPKRKKNYSYDLLWSCPPSSSIRNFRGGIHPVEGRLFWARTGRKMRKPDHRTGNLFTVERSSSGERASCTADTPYNHASSADREYRSGRGPSENHPLQDPL